MTWTTFTRIDLIEILIEGIVLFFLLANINSVIRLLIFVSRRD